MMAKIVTQKGQEADYGNSQVARVGAIITLEEEVLAVNEQVNDL